MHRVATKYKGRKLRPFLFWQCQIVATKNNLILDFTNIRG